MTRLALAMAALAIVGAIVLTRPAPEPAKAESTAASATAPQAPRTTRSRASSSTVVHTEQAPHLDALLELPHDELAQLVNDPVAARELVRADLEAQAEHRARTELQVAAVPIDDPAALERALAAAREARQTPWPR